MRKLFSNPIFRITFYYTIFSVIWITVSDTALENMISDPYLKSRISIYKGWFFVAITSILLFNLLKSEFSHRFQREKELEAIANFSLILRETTSRQGMLAITLDRLLNIFQAEAALVGILANETGEIVFELTRGNCTILTGAKLPHANNVHGEIIAQGTPYFSDHVNDDPKLVFFRRCNMPEHIAGIPLIAENQGLGVLWIGRNTKFNQFDRNLLASLANIISNTLNRITLFEKTEQQYQRLTALRAIDVAISSSLDPDLVISVFLEQVMEQLNVDAAAILTTADPNLGKLVFKAGKGFKNHNIELSVIHLDDPFLQPMFTDQKTVEIDLLLSGDDFPRTSLLASEKFINYIGVPLEAKNQVKGILEIYQRQPKLFNREWFDYLEILAGQAAIALNEAELFTDLQRSNIRLMEAYGKNIEGWSRALDLRDKETEGHTQRVTEMTLKLAQELSIDPAQLQNIRWGALLHDIGKMGIPDRILLKPGPLTDEEWEIMRKHPDYARNLLSPIEFLQGAMSIPYCHHEKWDGSGYPNHLHGELIPLEARIFAVIDVYDALTSDRPYRTALSQPEALKYIEEQSGIYFDPQIVTTFLKMVREKQFLFE